MSFHRLVLSCIVLLLGCADGHTDCLGPVGKFSGYAELSANNCIGSYYLGNPYTMEIGDSSPYRKCGDHELGEHAASYPDPACSASWRRALTTYPDKYVGFLFLEIKCKESRGCLSIYEIAFK